MNFPGFDDQAIYRRTRRGGIKLVDMVGYEYFRTNCMANGVQAWRCVNFTGSKYEKCSVRAYTQSNGTFDKVKVTGTHLHLPRVA